MLNTWPDHFRETAEPAGQNIAGNISAMMDYGGKSLKQAVKTVMRDKLKPGDGGVIAVSRNGDIVLQNTKRMFRGLADSTGRFEVKLWAD